MAISHPIICPAICSVFVVWRYNDQHLMQFPTRPLLTPVVTI
jgi:hypothetical protein